MNENERIGKGMMALANAELLASIFPPCEPINKWCCGCQDYYSSNKPVTKYYGESAVEAVELAVAGMIPWRSVS